MNVNENVENENVAFFLKDVAFFERCCKNIKDFIYWIKKII